MLKFYAVKIDFGKVPEGEVKALAKKIGKAMKEEDAVPMVPESPENPWFYALFRTRKEAGEFRGRHGKEFPPVAFKAVRRPAMIPESEFTEKYLEELGRKA